MEITSEQWGEQFEKMAHKAEPGELPPDWGKDSQKLIAVHMAMMEATGGKWDWQLFFAE